MRARRVRARIAWQRHCKDGRGDARSHEPGGCRWIRFASQWGCAGNDGLVTYRGRQASTVRFPFDRSQTMLDRMRFLATAAARSLFLIIFASALAVGGAVRRRGAAQGRLRLRRPGRRRRLDLCARPGAAGAREGVLGQGQDHVRRKRARRRGCRARHSPARGRRPQGDLHHLLRLHERDRQGRPELPERDLRACDRLQDRQEPGRVRSAFLRGRLPARRHRRAR